MGERWQARTLLAVLVTLGVFLVPIFLSVGASFAFAHEWPGPHAAAGRALWWILALTISLAIYAGTSRVAKRALPLATLLRMTLLFPDKAPSRMAVARKAGSTRGLQRQLESLRRDGADEEPVAAAEQILTLAALLNKHDRHTRGHSERVRVLTDLIADQLKLPQEDRDRLRWSALLHDIGKLTVSPAILNKAGKPDEQEWLALKNHPLEGARLAAPLAHWLGAWAHAIEQHHEKFDGSGYPYGLAGESISLGARIVAVADCFETMTAVRSYKAAVSPQAARRELAACAGTHFDPVIVRAFLEASLGRYHIAGAPLAALADSPLLTFVQRATQIVSTAAPALGFAAVAGLGAGAVAGAVHASQVSPAPHVALAQAAPTARQGPADRLGTTSPVGVVAAAPAAPPTSITTSAPSAPNAPNAPTSPAPVQPPATSVPVSPSTPQSPVPPQSATLTPLTVPRAPSVPAGTAGDASVALHWSAPSTDGGSAVTGYVVTPYVGTTPEATQSFTTTDGTVTGLVNGTTYTFTVAATNAAGTGAASGRSATLTPITTTLPPPQPPTNLAAAGSCQLLVIGPEISLDWTASATTSVVSYVVLRSTNGTTYSRIVTVSATTTSYVDTSVTIGSVYWYEVEAVAPGGSATSGSVSATAPLVCL
jgi:HD domain/Fibronectin type III domain